MILKKTWFSYTVITDRAFNKILSIYVRLTLTQIKDDVGRGANDSDELFLSEIVH